MLGAIAGDIVGSRFEWNNIKTKDFKLFNHQSRFTDDSIMTLAIAKAVLTCQGDYSQLHDQTIRCMQEVGRPYPKCGWGGRFFRWIYSDDPQPYDSFGNGSAMRVSAVAWVAQSLDECIAMSKTVTEVSHSHPEGIKGAEAIAVATYLALHGSSKEEIRAYISEHYYPLNFTLDEIRPTYSFDVSCQGTVPPAIEAFLESTDFEDAIRNAISIGGDSDTIAACTGAIAEAFYGMPSMIRNISIGYLDFFLRPILEEFERVYPGKIEH